MAEREMIERFAPDLSGYPATTIIFKDGRKHIWHGGGAATFAFKLKRMRCDHQMFMEFEANQFVHLDEIKEFRTT